MKKRLIIFSVAIMAFLAMPLLRVSAANSDTSREEMGGVKVYGGVNIYEKHASANAGCDSPAASVTVDLIYVYINYDTGRVETRSSRGYGCGGVVTTVSSPHSNCRSDNATATYYVKLGDFQWTHTSQNVTLY